jgi:uncharacterized LabA/DUF88 family protein
MAKLPFQRVGVFVDVQNMYYSALKLYSARANFGAILKEVVGERQLVRAIAYVIRAQIQEEQGFFEALRKSGYDVKSKDLQVFATGAKKGDWDVGLAIDVIRMVPSLDAVVLVSGDGDYVDLIQYIKSLRGTRAEVAAFGKSTAAKLIEIADDFIDLDESPKKFLIPMRR